MKSLIWITGSFAAYNLFIACASGYLIYGLCGFLYAALAIVEWAEGEGAA